MEKPKKPLDQTKITKHSMDTQKRVIWDCGSSLYDSFELKSFEKQLNSAIASRTNSMPHLSDRRLPNPNPNPNPNPPPKRTSKKHTSKFSRSINRLLRAVFRPKNDISRDKLFNNNSNTGRGTLFEDGYFSQRYNDHGSPVLSTISEIPEYDELMMSPDHKFNLKRRVVSDRFSGGRVVSSIGISCV